MAPIAIPASELLKAPPSREFILLAGKDGVGKTSAVISLADLVAQMTPEAHFYVIDTENKFRVTLQSYGAVPSNLVYYKAETMNEVTDAFDAVMDAYQPGDWLAVESMARIWERAQDLGYQAITGTDKVRYMEKRRATAPGAKQPPVTPRPDDLWSIIKGAHDTAFLDRISQTEDLHVVLTTTMSKPRMERANRKESGDRTDFRAETGLDMNLDGAPRLPTYIQTGVLLERVQGQVIARVWRDNMSRLDDPQIAFTVENRKMWAMQFWAETGR